MDPKTRIKTIIIDHDEDSMFILKDYLSRFPEVELKGYTSVSQKAKELLNQEKPDLIFAGIESRGLLNSMDERDNPQVVYIASDEQSLIRMQYEPALDFFVKPVTRDDLYRVINRYKKQRLDPLSVVVPQTGDSAHYNLVSLPTLTGLRFLNSRSIVLFQCIRETKEDKPQWQALLSDFNHVKLHKRTTAKEITVYMSRYGFAQINQSILVNLIYVKQIEFKAHICSLISPFDKLRLTVSRKYMAALKERFDLL